MPKVRIQYLRLFFREKEALGYLYFIPKKGLYSSGTAPIKG
jgi:hypothetical protein